MDYYEKLVIFFIWVSCYSRIPSKFSLLKLNRVAADGGDNLVSVPFFHPASTAAARGRSDLTTAMRGRVALSASPRRRGGNLIL